MTVAYHELVALRLAPRPAARLARAEGGREGRERPAAAARLLDGMLAVTGHDETAWIEASNLVEHIDTERPRLVEHR